MDRPAVVAQLLEVLRVSLDVAGELGVPVLGKMPIDPALAEAVESEKFYESDNQYLSDAVNKL